MKQVKKIVIVGLGLMGASLAAKVKKAYPKAKVIAFTRNQKAIDFTKKKKWIHQGFTRAEEAFHDADFIVMCTPVQTIIPMMKKIDQLVTKKVIVTDVGSTKKNICEKAARQKWKNIQFIGAHPMVGSHERGASSARADLYDDGLTVLMKSKSMAYSTVKQFWKKVSAKVVEMSPKLHDQYIAQVSHLPHAVAACLIQSVATPALKVSSTGLRDTTRTALGSLDIWIPIFEENRGEVLKALKNHEKTVQKLQKVLKSKNTSELRGFLRKSLQIRKSLS